ncbi:N-acetylmuramoyl-L-alanine amidase [Phaeacidiphilus oryzae]|uniref:N-acetylmuramoyl-L-alanine amidase n=1 Tax=Phaeacidiphilus oryzae TaxID=348818 RepID=UPI00068D271D|nr:peptidoglycan recognition family protein [Phaeacidiphilus oryzae]
MRAGRTLAAAVLATAIALVGTVAGTAGTTAQAGAPPAPECPASLHCRYAPAAYALVPGAKSASQYGDYDLANRPEDGDRIDTIVIHDTETSAAAAIHAFQHPADQASAHYLIGRDGSVTQLVPDRDIAWHAGNKYVNAHSIGIEHEGYAMRADFTEAEYRASAELVRWLAARYGIPLDRDHVIGHDEVPAPDAAHTAGMHWDPGPYWNWRHYLALLGTRLKGARRTPRVGETVTVDPPYGADYQPRVTGCDDVCPARPASFVYLRTGPSAYAPLITDPLARAGLKQPTGTTLGADWTDKAVVGQRFVVAAVRGDWTAIWFDGQRAWFHNPDGAAALASRGDGAVRGPAPLSGTAYPSASDFAAAGVPAPAAPAGPSRAVPAGQAYPAAGGAPLPSDYYYTDALSCSAPTDCLRVTGAQTYTALHFNHRLAFTPTR